MRYELTDFEWAAISSFLPNKPRGIPRVDDRRVLSKPTRRCSLTKRSGDRLRAGGEPVQRAPSRVNPHEIFLRAEPIRQLLGFSSGRVLPPNGATVAGESPPTLASLSRSVLPLRLTADGEPASGGKLPRRLSQ
jgi:hypothetical protein